MHIEFRHLRTIKAIHECGGLARAADQLNITQSALSHQIKGLEDQAGVELVPAPLETDETVGGRAAPCCGWPSRSCRRSKPRSRNFRRCGMGAPGGCTSPSNAMPVSNGCSRCLKHFGNPGAMLMWISARVWPLTRCLRCKKKRSIWSCLPTPRTCRASSLWSCSTMTRCSWPHRRIRWRRKNLSRPRIFAVRP